MPNADDIFRLFEEGDPNGDARVEKIVNQLDEIGSTTEFQLGMFTKLIQNNIVFQEKLEKFFKDIGKKYDKETTKKSSEYTVFNRAWYYIEKVDADSDEFVTIILEHNMNYTRDALERAVLYFEQQEEYEKCAHLFKILEIIKKV